MPKTKRRWPAQLNTHMSLEMRARLDEVAVGYKLAAGPFVRMVLHEQLQVYEDRLLRREVAPRRRAAKSDGKKA